MKNSMKHENTVTISLEEYNNLRDFKKLSEENECVRVYLGYNYEETIHGISKDELYIEFEIHSRRMNNTIKLQQNEIERLEYEISLKKLPPKKWWKIW